jgi:hypothetical protein
MKWIALLLMLFSNVCYSQECDSLTKVLEDKFTGKTGRLIREPITILDSTSSSALMLAVKQQPDKTIEFIAMVVNSETFGCTDETGQLFFIFDDNTKFNCRNQASYNCDGNSIVELTKMFGNKKLKDLLSTKLVKSIRVSGRKSNYDADLDLEDAKRLKGALNCLLNN